MTCPPGCRVWASRSSRRDEEWTDDGRLRGDPAVQGAELGASVYGVELGASVYGAELPAKSAPCQRRAQDLGANNDGAEQCKLGALLGASNFSAELRI